MRLNALKQDVATLVNVVARADRDQTIRQAGSFFQSRYSVGRISAADRKVRTEKIGICGTASAAGPPFGPSLIASWPPAQTPATEVGPLWSRAAPSQLFVPLE